jgi:hypothetical protein
VVDWWDTLQGTHAQGWEPGGLQRGAAPAPAPGRPPAPRYRSPGVVPPRDHR